MRGFARRCSVLLAAIVVCSSALALAGDQGGDPEEPGTITDSATFVPPNCTSNPFPDVLSGDLACPWIKQLAADQVSIGCGGGNYCPDDPVTRRQLAVLLGKVMRGTPTWNSVGEGASCAWGALTGQFWFYFGQVGSLTAACQLEETEVNDGIGLADTASGKSALFHGAITPVLDKDFFSVVAGPSTGINARTFSSIDRGVETCTVDTLVRIYDQMGTEIATADAGGTGTCGNATFIGTTLGQTYYVSVEESGNNATLGSYRLQVNGN